MDENYIDNETATTPGMSSTVKTHETIKYLDVMDLLETYPIIRRIMMNMAGVERRNVNGSYQLFREKPPQFTDEFVKDLGTKLMMHANQVTSYTCLKEDQIKSYLKHRIDALITMVFTIGRDHYISYESWKKIIDIHKKKIEINLYKGSEITGKKKVSGWYDHIDRDWKPENITSQEMLKVVRDRDERGDYNTVAGELWLDVFNFLQSAAYLSREVDGGFGNLQAHSQNSQRIDQVSSQGQIRKPGLVERMRRKFSGVGQGY